MRASHVLSLLALVFAMHGHAFAQLVLHPQPLLDRPAGAWADTVVVAYDVQEPIGTFRRINGMGEEQAIHAVFEEHPAHVLKHLLGPGLIASHAPGSLLLKVNRLRVDEVGNKALCILHAEVLERTTEAHVRRFEGSVQVEGERCGRKPDCHEENINRAMREFLGYFERSALATTDAPVVSGPELTALFRVEASNTRSLADQTLRRGLYRTFMQFRDNIPDSLYEFDVRETLASTSQGDVVRLKHMSGEAAEQYWGLCDGTHAYARVGRSFVRLRRSENGFTALVPQPDSYDPGAVMLGGMFFGIVGGAVAGAASTTPNPPILCDLNMLGGDLAPHERKLVTKDYAMHVFHVSRFAKSDSAVTVACEGMPHVTIGRRQWTRFQFPPQVAKRSVTITGPVNSETVSIDTNSDKLVVYLIDLKKDGTLAVSELGEQLRGSVVSELKQEDKMP